MGGSLQNDKESFIRTLGTEFPLVLLGIQVVHREEQRRLVELELLIKGQLLVEELQTACERVAKWVGGDLYGTVNIDFSGTSPSLEMMVEVE